MTGEEVDKNAKAFLLISKLVKSSKVTVRMNKQFEGRQPLTRGVAMLKLTGKVGFDVQYAYNDKMSSQEAEVEFVCKTKLGEKHVEFVMTKTFTARLPENMHHSSLISIHEPVRLEDVSNELVRGGLDPDLKKSVARIYDVFRRNMARVLTLIPQASL